MVKDLINRIEYMSVVGLGYVGMPLAVAFSKKANVIGFDINSEKIEKYKSGIDLTKEIGDKELKNSSVYFTSDEDKLKMAKFHIIAVPTPITSDMIPNLKPIISATHILGRHLVKGSMVVYESTVYPGVTEEICMKILEEESGLKCGEDFKIGYSPERINPADKDHKLEGIKKIVSGIDDESLNTIADVYNLIIKAGVYKAESIKVAEAAKMIENSQRDINIAFMNELAIAFDKMGIDTKQVINAASTKWNFINFKPGLVGGHCIGVDPYYFIYKAGKLGYHSKIVSSGREINNYMPKFIVETTVKQMIKSDKKIKDSRVLLLGATFKENCPDIRNSKSLEMINYLNEYGMKVLVSDPIVNKRQVLEEYNIKMEDYKDIHDVDVIIFAVAHDEFRKLSIKQIKEKFKSDYSKNVIIDVKGILNDKELSEDIVYWRL